MTKVRRNLLRDAVADPCGLAVARGYNMARVVELMVLSQEGLLRDPIVEEGLKVSAIITEEGRLALNR